MQNNKRKKSILRIRSKFGQSVRFEVLFLKSNANLYFQLNDLLEKKTLFSSGTNCFKKENKNKNVKSTTFAIKLSEVLSTYCIENKINDIAINVANYRFHGLIKAFSENLFKKISSN